MGYSHVFLEKIDENTQGCGRIKKINVWGVHYEVYGAFGISWAVFFKNNTCMGIFSSICDIGASDW